MGSRRQAIKKFLVGAIFGVGNAGALAKPDEEHHATNGKAGRLPYDPTDRSVDIRTFGAVCDGVTDDTAAFTRAILAVKYTGRKLHIPAGVTAVRSLPLYSHLVIEGEGAIFNEGLDTQCSTVKGIDDAVNVFYLADDGEYVNSVQIRNLQISGGLNCINLSKGITNLNLRDVRLSNPKSAAIVSRTWLERCVFDHVEFSGGKIGFQLVNNGTISNYMDKCVFMNKCRFFGQSLHGILIDCYRPCNSNEFIGPVFNTIGQTPFMVLAPAWDWTIVDPNFEQNGIAGPPVATTTGSITKGARTLSVKSRTNLLPGQMLTIQGAGKDGDDLFAKVTAISGIDVTLDAVASGTVENADVTNCLYDEIFFGDSSKRFGNLSTGVTIIGAALGYAFESDRIRYAVHAAHARNIRFIGCRLVNRPVYDPFMNCEFIGTQGYVRTISTPTSLPTVWRNLRAGEGSEVYGLSPTPSVYPGNPGTGAVLALRGTGPNEQSGVFGRWSVSKTGPNRHALLQVDGDTGNVIVGPTGEAADALNLGIGTATFHNARMAIAMTNGKAPNASLPDGGYLFVEAGALKYRGSNGTVTMIAPA